MYLIIYYYYYIFCISCFKKGSFSYVFHSASRIVCFYMLLGLLKTERLFKWLSFSKHRIMSAVGILTFLLAPVIHRVIIFKEVF